MKRTLGQFLKIKGNNTITKRQQFLFRVPDFSKNWNKRHADIELCPKQWSQAIMSLVESEGKFRMLQTKKYSSKQYLYLMKNSVGMLKIGVSTDPTKRLKALQNASGLEIEIIGVWDCKVDAFIVERTLHVAFDLDRGLGEWFSTSPDSVFDYINNDIPGIAYLQ